MARLMAEPRAARIGDGVYRVEHDGRAEIVYVAGPPEDVWAFWNGQVFHDAPESGARARRSPPSDARQSLAAPMPATVLKVLVQPGTAVRKGDTVILLEAMKMELPIRTAEDGIVTAVHCREGEIVQADTVLVELESR
jgi:3-methylcrotonyl-CoA carboxylase alpha subunit